MIYLALFVGALVYFIGVWQLVGWLNRTHERQDQRRPGYIQDSHPDWRWPR